MKYSISIHAYAIFMEVIYDKFGIQAVPKTIGARKLQEVREPKKEPEAIEDGGRGWSGMGTNALEVGVFVV